MVSTPGFEPRPHWWEASALTLDAPRGVATAERQKGCIAGKSLYITSFLLEMRS